VSQQSTGAEIQNSASTKFVLRPIEYACQVSSTSPPPVVWEPQGFENIDTTWTDIGPVLQFVSGEVTENGDSLNTAVVTSSFAS